MLTVVFLQQLVNLQTKINNHKKMTKHVTISGLFLLVCSFMACNNEITYRIKIKNPSSIERSSEIVILGNNELSSLTGSFPSGLLPLFIFEDDTLITQFIDNDNNSSPEEILIQVDMKAEEEKVILVKYIDASTYPVFPKLTNIRFVKKSDLENEILFADRLQTYDVKRAYEVYQLEGPVWENDKVGFRNYFDYRNGIDIFGKKTSKMVLDGIGLGDDYHTLADWGMDILKVGTSLGSGGIGTENNGRLFRIGDNGSSTYEKITEGNLKSEFRLNFKDWQMMDQQVNVDHYISIWAGQYAFKSTLFVNGLPENTYLIAGIVNMHSDTLYTEKFDGITCVFTHGEQSENKDILAMAILVPDVYFAGVGKASDSGAGIIQTYYTKLKPDDNNKAEYFFFSLWEGSDKRFNKVDDVKEFLKQEALKLYRPLEIIKMR
jgi:hypothetical protein